MEPIIQISLDLTTIDEALEVAHAAVKAGVDWLEAGTPLILAEGLHGVRALRKEFPNHPIVADLKTMDGAGLEAEMMFQAGANFVVVMGQAHDASIIEQVNMAEEKDPVDQAAFFLCRAVRSSLSPFVIGNVAFDQAGLIC